ncbi:uncharacterized protein BT62DRAFT_1081800 [Guyanagaster necrorhizus]|uniref:Uncharacterized protein n=1 Tax=Guyanagaster necrorhizus TaxID=856835 RepID=A0A9P7VE84_9AGAR|nr:uncharacterized protein BT62DRAFT_939298 [Guyanagaster necrorhizus MCA 3950]XP_043032593.1 uncharacterized protein BT62DRAFT_1081800 [Guyanagaster necrorhizus MCA 3950]KAG7439073.1 hypothetical protein BT62DRAFT_939298 [Guyanagaster necrorhizus MCA 3950]KAG7439089.1 hypothetical protein BT62DRAFT_1081800 [Guyanagaster necrorhizus MCA 3950]
MSSRGQENRVRAKSGFIAPGNGYYISVSGNWCWLTPELVFVRDVLTHGSRSSSNVSGQIYLQ